MSARIGKLGSGLVFALVLSACIDAPGPVGPGVAPGDDVLGAAAQDTPARWFAQAAPVVLGLPAAVFADHDETTGRLVFGIQNAAAAMGVRQQLAALGIPASAYELRVVQPIYQAASLRDVWRPTQGGIQIHFGQYVCTMGFNADDGTSRSFITNSHCTNRQGGVESTPYYQPASSVDGTVIATEVEDPDYFRGGACPKGRKCRWSDAARAAYSASVASNRGSVAKTTGANNGSLDVVGSFSITSQDNTTTSFPIGLTVNKVGRTTGWTEGIVTATCVHTNVSGSNVTQLCQSFVENPGGAVVVGGGDSGSQVFRITSGDNVQLVGLLWGGSGDNKLFVFSPLKQVRDEIGPINAVK